MIQSSRQLLDSVLIDDCCFDPTHSSRAYQSQNARHHDNMPLTRRQHVGQKGLDGPKVRQCVDAKRPVGGRPMLRLMTRS